jgi:ABC-type nitrate/sulfonate/bicarbonate transport system substrate-binding protein
VNRFSFLALAALLAGCGGAAAPASLAPASPSSTAAKPVASASAPAAAAGQPKPEKAKITVARSAPGGTFIPILIASDAGYFTNHGLDVTLDQIAPPVANAGLASGSVDVYEGATSVITAILGGADLVYVAAPVDRNNQVLVGKPGLTTFTALKGKSISTTSAGAFGDIAARWSAKKFNMQASKDFKLVYNPQADGALSEFLNGQVDATLIPPPYSDQAKAGGNPVIVDYYSEDFRVVGPGTAVSRSFFQKNPNTIKAFLMGYLDGLKRAIDDPAFAKQIDAKYSKLDAALLDPDYQQASKQWNKDLTVNPSAIQVVLDASDDPKAKAGKPADMYDNSLISAVNAEYGKKLFPNDIK